MGFLPPVKVVIQATVDHRGRFTSYELGWPGSVQDSRIFKESAIWKELERYFRDHEYIIVDKGAFQLKADFYLSLTNVGSRLPSDRLLNTAIQRP